MYLNTRNQEDVIYVSVSGNAFDSDHQELIEQMKRLLDSEFEEMVFQLANVPVATKQTIGKHLMIYRNTAENGKLVEIKGIHDGNLVLGKSRNPFLNGSIARN
ncbi:MAG TPA: hypothetical protein PKV71_02980 [Calditrichia bacterium]|nr:hypothetical protein [Calditrichota bacterium]HQU74906.1 hypothetical protein [Calditrichia bacterium]HQV30807.1 hypothetical protein [Calditrichia bacterium]